MSYETACKIISEAISNSLREENDYPYLCVNCDKPSNSHLCDECKELHGDFLGQHKGGDLPQISRELNRDKLEQFILGGNATFTLYNTKKGTHLTYKIRVCKDNPELFFVSVLTGSDNWTNYSFLGVIRERIYWHGKKSKISKDAPSAKTFEWFYNNLDRLPPALSVMHEGKCGRCGRKLTVPESILSGFGPECQKYL